MYDCIDKRARKRRFKTLTQTLIFETGIEPYVRVRGDLAGKKWWSRMQ